MREFIDDYNKIEYRLVDRNGKAREIESRPLPINEHKKLQKLLKDFNDETKNVTIVDLLISEMVLIFGGTEKDYGGYSVNMLQKVLDDYRKYLVNPQQAEQETTTDSGPEKSD